MLHQEGKMYQQTTTQTTTVDSVPVALPVGQAHAVGQSQVAPVMVPQGQTMPGMYQNQMHPTGGVPPPSYFANPDYETAELRQRNNHLSQMMAMQQMQHQQQMQMHEQQMRQQQQQQSQQGGNGCLEELMCCCVFMECLNFLSD
mmetsp:Transcript_12117/g.19721  ORF Transcript_12117/g.19721 Transcript_12117/m.19721 type:complete len:144 (-) Transcript_12117:450-881(-)